jgi:hypothetical protein
MSFSGRTGIVSLGMGFELLFAGTSGLAKNAGRKYPVTQITALRVENEIAWEE